MSVPTAPGFYWYRDAGENRVREVTLVSDSGFRDGLYAWDHGNESEELVDPDDPNWGPQVAEPSAVAALEERLARIAEHDLQMDKCWICGSDEWVHDGGRAHWQIESGLCPIQAPQ